MQKHSCKLYCRHIHVRNWKARQFAKTGRDVPITCCTCPLAECVVPRVDPYHAWCFIYEIIILNVVYFSLALDQNFNDNVSQLMFNTLWLNFLYYVTRYFTSHQAVGFWIKNCTFCNVQFSSPFDQIILTVTSSCHWYFNNTRPCLDIKDLPFIYSLRLFPDRPSYFPFSPPWLSCYRSLGKADNVMSAY